MQIALIQRDLAGKRSQQQVNVGLLSFLKSLATAGDIEQLAFEERAQLAAWLHGWKDDEWDDQMKRDIAAGKLDTVLREVDDDIRAGRVSEPPLPAKEIALELIQKLPADSTFDDIRERIEFIAGVRKGLDEIKQGQAVPNEKLITKAEMEKISAFSS